MTDFNNKESKFKNILEEMEFELDTQQVWGAIEDRLPKKERKRFGIFWLFAGLLIGILSTALFVNLYQQNIIEASVSSSEVFNSKVINSELNNSTSSELRYTSDNSKEKVNAESLNESIHNNIPDSPIDKNRNNESPIGLSIGNSLSNSFIENKLGSSRVLSVFSLNNNVSPLYSLNQRDGKSLLNGRLFVSMNAAQDLRNVELLDVESIPSINPNAIDSGDIILLDTPFSKLKPWQSMIGLVSGFNQTILNDQIFNTLENSQAFEKESGVYGFNTGIRYTVEHKSSWQIYGELNYYSQVVRYRDFSTSTQEETYISDIPVINLQGEFDSEQGELTRTTLSFNDLQHHRRHQYLDLNIGVAKSVLNFGNLSLNADASLAYNLMSNHKGYYLDDDGGFQKIEGEDHNYVSSSNFALRGGFSISYRLGAYELSLHPYYQKRFNSLVNTNNYKRRDDLAGLNLLLSYLLN